MDGKLVVYLGYAVGVGKTYRMLLDAHTLLRGSINVVSGYIEPHNRPETTKMANGIMSVSPITIEYRGMQLTEANVSEIIIRKPKVVLIDEIAHTNAPGTKNKKRYEDVLEILNAGIDVYTTMNVQHLASLHDSIFAEIGIKVQETIPDSVIENASTIKHIDIPVPDLIDRIIEGKIFTPDKISIALSNFFSKRKLDFLRELTLLWCKKHKKIVI